MGDSPVYMKVSYKNPPNVHPIKGAIMGICQVPTLLVTLTDNPFDSKPQSSEDTYPKVITSGTPHLISITDEIGEQSRSEISGQINRVAGFPAERGADAEDQEEQPQRDHVAGAEIRVVLKRENDKHKNRARDDFAEELARLGQEGLRVGAEDAGRRGVAVPGHGAQVAAAFVRVDGGFVVAVDDGGAAEAAGDLRAGVDGEFPPGEFAEEAVYECNGRVEICGVYEVRQTGYRRVGVGRFLRGSGFSCHMMGGFLGCGENKGEWKLTASCAACDVYAQHDSDAPAARSVSIHCPGNCNRKEHGITSTDSPP